MGGACEAAARGGARAEEAHLISSEARKAGSKPPKAGKNRTAARVDELPQEAREVIDRMLMEGDCTYQRIAEALEKEGFFITKGAVGRHEAGKAADERMEKLLDKQLDALNRWMEKQSGFDAAGAALALVIGKLGRRIGNSGEMFADLSADKATAGLIQAARAAVQYEKTAGERKKLRAEARAEALKELREALKREPELWERIEELVAEGS